MDVIYQYLLSVALSRFLHVIFEVQNSFQCSWNKRILKHLKKFGEIQYILNVVSIECSVKISPQEYVRLRENSVFCLDMWRHFYLLFNFIFCIIFLLIRTR